MGKFALCEIIEDRVYILAVGDKEKMGVMGAEVLRKAEYSEERVREFLRDGEVFCDDGYVVSVNELPEEIE